MARHARLACDEAGHWMSSLARAEQVAIVRRGEVKVAASEDRSLSLTCRASWQKKIIIEAGLTLQDTTILGKERKV